MTAREDKLDAVAEYHDMTQPACGRCNVCGVCSRWYHGWNCPCQQATVDATSGRTPSEEHVCVDCPQPCPECDYCAVEQGRTPSRRTCSMYLSREDDYCQRKGLWRPASIPMNPDWWFCKQHAKQIAQEEGTYGVYQHNGEVEELPMTPPARTTSSDGGSADA